jgi:hypothetical protein
MNLQRLIREEGTKKNGMHALGWSKFGGEHGREKILPQNNASSR